MMPAQLHRAVREKKKKKQAMNAAEVLLKFFYFFKCDGRAKDNFCLINTGSYPERAPCSVVRVELSPAMTFKRTTKTSQMPPYSELPPLVSHHSPPPGSHQQHSDVSPWPRFFSFVHEKHERGQLFRIDFYDISPEQDSHLWALC